MFEMYIVVGNDGLFQLLHHDNSLSPLLRVLRCPIQSDFGKKGHIKQDKVEILIASDLDNNQQGLELR